MMGCFIRDIYNHEFNELTAFNFVDRNERITYKEIRKKVSQLQNYLKTQGLKRGDKILVSTDKEDDFLICFLSVISLGAIMVPVSPMLTNHELEEILKATTIRFSLTKYTFLLDHHHSLTSVQFIEGHFSLDHGQESLPTSIFFKHSFVEFSSVKLEDMTIPDPSQIITCHFTFKGFGIPLGVEHTYSDYCLSIESCDDFYNFTPGLKLLSLLPVSPVFGLVTSLLFPMASGCELVIQDKKHSGILKAIQKHEIDHVNVVPAIMERMLLEAKKSDEIYDLSKICMVAGGSHVSAELHDVFLKTFNLAPVQGYGLTETLPILSNHPDKPKRGTLGINMRPKVEIKIMDEKGFEVPKGKAGEICLKGQGIIDRYLGDGDYNKTLFRDGWLRTGDLACLDEEGHVIFLGRRLNFTKILGNMVDFKEIENEISKLSGIREVRSYLIHENGRDKINTDILVIGDFQHTRKEILDHCRKNLSSFKVPSQIKIFKCSYNEVL